VSSVNFFGIGSTSGGVVVGNNGKDGIAVSIISSACPQSAPPGISMLLCRAWK
jgi:hypothetical protein